MVVDFHTHTFPEKIVDKAIAKLEESADMKAFLDGTISQLRQSMERCGVDLSVLLPVATSKKQYQTVNRVAAEINATTPETGILSLGGIHPENDNYREILQSLKENGCKGIKIHPVYQSTDIDDVRYLRIISCAEELNLITLAHAGYDIGFPGATQAVPKKICRVLDELHPTKLVLAHMGGWGCWDEVEEYIAGRNVYLDTSFSHTSPKREGAPLSMEQFTRIVKKHGAHRILLGSDSPWSDQGESIEVVEKCDISRRDKNKILGENAVKLLEL
ncbi:MAG: amidohydrolase family protein [Lachnospiraceae bacterium]|nr:amidohydrolase family protein [Lachnospiraceae bacterium]